MGEDVRRLFRRAESALLRAWAGRHGLDLYPPDLPDRSRWTGETYAALATGQQEALAALTSEAELIAELGQPSRDWVFADLLRLFPGEVSEQLDGRAPESKALALWLSNREAFEWAERRSQVFAQSGKRRLCTRYRCVPCPQLRVVDTDLRPFVEALKALYHSHDFSGDRIIPIIDWDIDTDGNRRAFTLHASVSRQLVFEQSFDESGDLGDLPLRRPTKWRCRLDIHTGEMDLICDRGGQKLRKDSADLFVDLVLRQADPPIAIEAPEFDLAKLTDLDTLPLLDGQTEWRAVEICVSDSSKETEQFVVSSHDDAWETLRRLTQSARGDTGLFALQSVTVEALFEHGSGGSARAEKVIKVEAMSDGQLKIGADGVRHILVRDLLAQFLSEAA